jgi:hypothetical protein
MMTTTGFFVPAVPRAVAAGPNLAVVEEYRPAVPIPAAVVAECHPVVPIRAAAQVLRPE